MADQDRSLSKALSNFEQELTDVPAPPPAPSRPAVVESFAPQRYRNASDTMEQIQQDLRKALADAESRFKTLMDELKRVAG